MLPRVLPSLRNGEVARPVSLSAPVALATMLALLDFTANRADAQQVDHCVRATSGGQYIDCVMINARRLSVVNESPEKIASSAVATCEGVRKMLVTLVDDCGGPGLAAVLFADLVGRGHEAAIAVVSRLRTSPQQPAN